ncbi:MAG: hypothetical protein JWO53_544 [Chlamydiia bacterium]|nr:hypothetical protein [Chlamydiia bacterium]
MSSVVKKNLEMPLREGIMSGEWDKYSNWKEAETAWDEGAEKARKTNPLNVLKTLPSMPGISNDAAKHLKWKSLKWMVKMDSNWAVTKYILKKPFVHAWRYLKSLCKKKSYTRDEDFFLYNIASVDQFKSLLDDPDSLLVIGFSYCQKPHECPSKRFTPDCIHDPENPVCRQCFIGKSMNALPSERAKPVIIPTIHYIGEKIFEVIEKNPTKKIVFLITACELTLEMFGDFGNMAGVRGIGVRLDGRICNTMRAFELSETGIKPGLTVVLKGTEQRMLDLIYHFRSTVATTSSTIAKSTTGASPQRE